MQVPPCGLHAWRKGGCGVWGLPSLPTCHLFLGLSLSEAKKLSSYFHFREPVELRNKTLLEKADLDPSLDFMDSLEHDIPKGNSLGLGGHCICPQVTAVCPAPCHSPWRSKPRARVGTGGSRGFLEGGDFPRAQSRARLIINSRPMSADKRKPCLPCDSTDRTSLNASLDFHTPLEGGRLGILSQTSLKTSLKILATRASHLSVWG